MLPVREGGGVGVATVHIESVISACSLHGLLSKSMPSQVMVRGLDEAGLVGKQNPLWDRCQR